MSITDKTQSRQPASSRYLLAKAGITHAHRLWPWALGFVRLSALDPGGCQGPQGAGEKGR